MALNPEHDPLSGGKGSALPTGSVWPDAYGRDGQALRAPDNPLGAPEQRLSLSSLDRVFPSGWPTVSPQETLALLCMLASQPGRG